VNIPCLSLGFWYEEVFREIRNSLERFIEANMSFQVIRNFSLARILFGLDLKYGLTIEIFLQKGFEPFVQILDYYGATFRCVRCHKYGHLAMEFGMPFRNKF
jgi:hypothetical protein